MKLAASLVLFSAITALGNVSPVPKGSPRQSPRGPIRFASEIRPILSEYCFPCHGVDAKARQAGLRLDTEEGAKALLTGGRPVEALHPKRSRIVIRMKAPDSGAQMPPPAFGKRPSSVQIAKIEAWIRQGAKWEGHWAFISPVRPKVPKLPAGLGNPINPIDSFLLARLAQEKLRPSPEAGRETLIRRITLDLTGLPPTLKEIDDYLGDRAPGAYERLVDRLLSSPRFGERWVWEWLDAARYSDTNGYQEDRERPTWPWRDWAVRSINANMPFDQFTIEQIAGDLLPNPNTDQLIATGFHRNLMLNGEGGRIPEESRNDYVFDRVETTAATWLGLTFNCARCHDHKYDPFTMKDYYSLFAYFNQVDESGSVDFNGLARPVLPIPTEDQKRAIAEREAALKSAEAELNVVGKDDPARAAASKKVDDARKALDGARNSALHVMVMKDRAQPRDTWILLRGDYEKHGDKVHIATPAALPAKGEWEPNRLGLARWLVDRKNPLTARVVINRMWQELFGIGLVKTSENFGVQGEMPSHPELLDWLAVEFMESGWNVKRMIRLMVTSAAYRQTSAASPALGERDPENRLLARGSRYRWGSNVLRDQALALSGLLVEKLGGPPVRPYQPEGVWEDFSYGKITYKQDHGEALYRRSLYTFWRRSVAPTTFFDISGRRVCTVRNLRTNTPTQALTLLNDVTYLEAARKFAERSIIEGGASPEGRIIWMFRSAAGRKPTAQEAAPLLAGFRRRLGEFTKNPEAAHKLLAVGESPVNATIPKEELAAYATTASVILNLDEVLTKE